MSGVNSGLGGALKLITTQTFTNQATVSFTSGITSTYKEYIFKFFNLRDTERDYVTMYFQCSTDGGSNYNTSCTSSTFWSWNYVGMNDPAHQGVATYSAGQSNGTAFQQILTNIGSDGVKGTGIGELHLFTPASTTFVKHWYCRTANWRADDRVVELYAAGYFNTTSAINAIQFNMGGGAYEFQHDSKLKMYGVA